jgi:hypothetical protein
VWVDRGGGAGLVSAGSVVFFRTGSGLGLAGASGGGVIPNPERTKGAREGVATLVKRISSLELPESPALSLLFGGEDLEEVKSSVLLLLTANN